MKLSPEDEYLQQVMGESPMVYNSNISSSTNKNIQPKKTYKQLQVLLKDDSKLNDKLLDFLKRNLKKINNCGYKFEWIIVYEDEMEYYEEQEINKFPALLLENDMAFGLTDIKKSLNNLVNPQYVSHSNNSNSNSKYSKNSNSNKSNKPDNFESTGDEIRDYLMNECDPSKTCDEVNENDDFSNNMQKRMATMSKSRKEYESKGKKNNLNNNSNDDNDDDSGESRINSRNTKSSNVMDIVKQTNKGTQEDDMMEKFWQNNLAEDD